MTPAEVHNHHAPLIVESIIRPMLEAGGDTTDILVVLETVVTGVLLWSVKEGGDEKVVDILLKSVKERMAEIRKSGRKIPDRPY
jgi:hypothetical protein